MDSENSLCRIVYVSRAVGTHAKTDRESILSVSRRNNGMDGVTGILWAEGDRYLQLLEGPPESVDNTFNRILLDPRHDEVVVIDWGEHADRLFGDWAMAGLPGEAPADAISRLERLLRNAPSDVRRLFPRLG